MLTFIYSSPTTAQLSHRWTHYFGGDGVDGVAGLAIPASGTIVMAGTAEGIGAFKPDAPAGDSPQAALAWLTPYGKYHAGSGLGPVVSDNLRALAADPHGALWMAGWTDSGQFPFGLPGNQLMGNGDAFLLELPPFLSPSRITLLAGEGRDEANALAFAPEETHYVCGRTTSLFGIASASAAYRENRGGGDGFVAAYDAAGTKLWASFLGGGAADEAKAICHAPGGGVIVAGNTHSDDFPAVGGADSCSNGGQDVFLARLDEDGQLLWSTFLGGSGDDSACRLVWDGSGAILLGDTLSIDLPTPGGFDAGANGGRDLFLARWDEAGHLLWCSYYGGGGDEHAADLRVEPGGLLRVLATTTSPTLPALAETIGPGGMQDMALALLGEAGIPWETRKLGGSQRDTAVAMAMDARGIYLAGNTESPDWPRVYGPMNAFRGRTDIVVLGLKRGWAEDVFDLGLYWGSDADPLAPDLNVDGEVDALDALEMFLRWHK